MTYDHDDPRLTAYALGELDASQFADVQKILDDSEEARKYVEEIRLTAQWLAREFQKEAEAPPILSLANHRAIDQTLQQKTARAQQTPLVEESTGALRGRVSPGFLLRDCRYLHCRLAQGRPCPKVAAPTAAIQGRFPVRSPRRRPQHPNCLPGLQPAAQRRKASAI